MGLGSRTARPRCFGHLDQPLLRPSDICGTHAFFQYICFVPMVSAEVSTGFYLMLFSIKAEVPGGQSLL